MKLTTLPEPLLEFSTGTHVCPRTGIEHLGVYDKRDELRRTELRIGVVGRGEGIDLLDDWLERCRDGIERKEGSKLLNLFRGFGGINQDYGFLTRIINSPQYKRRFFYVPSMASRSAFGIRCAFPPEIKATRTRAVTKRSSPRLHSCSRLIDAPLTSSGTVTTSSRSSKIAGFRKSILIERTTKAKPGASLRASFRSFC